MKTIIEPFKIKVVEPLRMTTIAERAEILSAARPTVFGFRAREVLTAKEGNCIRRPGHVVAEVSDVDVAAASAILEAIKYYGVLKLQMFSMQWAALSATTGTGSFAAKKEDTQMFVLYFNSMMEGFASQLGEQLTPHLFGMNAEHFPQMTAPPHLTISKLDKSIGLEELSRWIKAMKDTGFDLYDQDALWIREKS